MIRRGKINFLECGKENFWELSFFFGGKMTEDKINVAEFLTDGGIVATKAKSRVIVGM